MPLSLDGTGSITGIVTVSVSDDLAHVGDVNTKITFPANDTITAETAGSERLRITSGGAVQITGVDDQDNLLVKSNNTHFAVHQDDSDGEVSLRAQDGSGSNNSKYMTFFTNPSGSAAVERLRINSSGKLIIGNNGTTFGNAAVQAFIQHGNTAGESGFSSVDTTSVAAGVGGEIAFHGKYNTGAQDWAYFGHIRGVKENATNGDTACALTFHTRPNATAPIERLRIDSGGNVGVGTNVANDSTGNCQAFKIARPVNGQVRLILQNSATGFGNGAGFHQGIDGSGVFIENRSNGGSIDFATFDSGGSYGMRFRITSDGTIGINETSPNSVLHVKNHNNNTADITIEGGGSGNAGIQFIPGGQTNSYFAYVDTNRNFRIQDHTSEKLRLVSGGNFAIGNTHGAKKIHISTYGNQKILIDPNYNNNSGGSSNSEANANNVVDSVLIRSSFGDNAASQTNAGHKWGIKFQGYNGNDFTQNTAKIAAVYAVSEDEATGYNKNVGLAFHTSPYNTTHREAMRINTNGAVTKPYHPAFAARLGSGTIDLTTAGGTDMVFNTEEFDNSGSYDTSNGRFTAPVAGKYYFGVQLYAGFNGTGVRVLHAHFRVNGTSVAQTDMFGGASNHGGTHYHPTAVGHMFRNLNKNDYVTFNLGGFSHSGGQAILYASTGNRFFGHLVC